MDHLKLKLHLFLTKSPVFIIFDTFSSVFDQNWPKLKILRPDFLDFWVQMGLFRGLKLPRLDAKIAIFRIFRLKRGKNRHFFTFLAKTSNFVKSVKVQNFSIFDCWRDTQIQAFFGLGPNLGRGKMAKIAKIGPKSHFLSIFHDFLMIFDDF